MAKEGSVAKACEKLLLSQPTISIQLRLLERSLGEKLLTRAGRGLKLTESGLTVYRYAEEIFALGKELTDSLRGVSRGRGLRLNVGVADVLAKLVSYRILKPILALPEGVQIVCREDKPDRLLAELSIHNLDVVLSDSPMGPGCKVRAFNHLLGDCGVSFMAVPLLAKRLQGRFPGSLTDAPVLLPTENTSLRQALDAWFERHNIRPDIRAEFEDSALLKVFGQAGVGAFAVPTAVEREVSRQYGVRLVGRVLEVREKFYAISVERKITHPAVKAISESARQLLFPDP